MRIVNDHCSYNIIFLLPLFNIAGILHGSQLSDSMDKKVPGIKIFAYEDDAIEDYLVNSQYTHLKLNISWRLPINRSLPLTSYSVIVSGISKELVGNHEDGIICPDHENIFYTTSNENETSVSLPVNKFLSEMPEIVIKPTCIYEIQVIANPRLDPNLDVAKVNFTVPKCVGKSCDCHDTYELLPIPQVRAKSVRADKIVIEWYTLSNFSSITSYILSYATPLLISKNDLPVYNISKLVQLPVNVSSYTLNADLSESILLGLGNRILIAAQDVNGCLGKAFPLSISEGNESISLFNNKFHNWPVYLLIITLSSIIIVGIGIIWNLKCQKYRIILQNYSSSSTPVTIRGLSKQARWIDAILKQHNTLYFCQHHDENVNLELCYKRLTFSKILGNGYFGKVYLAYLDNEEPVAVKLANPSSKLDEMEARRQLLDEIKTMKRIGSHKHLIGLIGYCTLPDTPMCVILEYAEGGDLLQYLHQLRDQSIISHCQISNSNQVKEVPIFNNGYINVQSMENYRENLTEMRASIDKKQFRIFAMEIASGMEYLEKNAIVHRDLAARNILIAGNMSLKISDFGLSRENIYIIGKDSVGIRRLPARWMAPETLYDRAFTNKSDVWSYGIVLWEIQTLGAFPYAEIQDDEILHHIGKIGTRLSIPDNTDDELRHIMQACWSTEPIDRPNFTDIVEILTTPSQLGYLITNSNNITSSSNPCYALLHLLPSVPMH